MTLPLPALPAAASGNMGVSAPRSHRGHLPEEEAQSFEGLLVATGTITDAADARAQGQAKHTLPAPDRGTIVPDTGIQLPGAAGNPLTSIAADTQSTPAASSPFPSITQIVSAPPALDLSPAAQSTVIKASIDRSAPQAAPAAQILNTSTKIDALEQVQRLIPPPSEMASDPGTIGHAKAQPEPQPDSKLLAVKQPATGASSLALPQAVPPGTPDLAAAAPPPLPAAITVSSVQHLAAAQSHSPVALRITAEAVPNAAAPHIMAAEQSVPAPASAVSLAATDGDAEAGSSSPALAAGDTRQTSVSAPPPPAAPGGEPASLPAHQAMPQLPGAVATQIPSRQPSGQIEPMASARIADGLDAVIDRLADARAGSREARSEMTLRHAEFGAVAVRLESIGSDLRATLSARDPGFVPAIQAALADRMIASAAETSAGQFQRNPEQRGHDQSTGHQSHSGQGAQSQSERGYGFSPGSQQGSSQPYRPQHSTEHGETAERANPVPSHREGPGNGRTGLFA